MSVNWFSVFFLASRKCSFHVAPNLLPRPLPLITVGADKGHGRSDSVLYFSPPSTICNTYTCTQYLKPKGNSNRNPSQLLQQQNHTVQCSLPKFYSFTRCYGSHVGDWLNYWVVRLICVFKNASKIGLAVKAANLKITGRPVLDKIMGDLLQTERVHISWYTSTTPTPELRRHSKKPVYTSWERNLLHFYMVTGAKAKGCELVETLSSTNDSRSPTVQSSQQAGFFSCSCQKASAIWDVALGQLHPY